MTLTWHVKFIQCCISHIFQFFQKLLTPPKKRKLGKSRNRTAIQTSATGEELSPGLLLVEGKMLLCIFSLLINKNEGWIWEGLKLPPEQAEGKQEYQKQQSCGISHPALLPQNHGVLPFSFSRVLSHAFLSLVNSFSNSRYCIAFDVVQLLSHV